MKEHEEVHTDLGTPGTQKVVIRYVSLEEARAIHARREIEEERNRPIFWSDQRKRGV